MCSSVRWSWLRVKLFARAFVSDPTYLAMHGSHSSRKSNLSHMLASLHLRAMNIDPDLTAHMDYTCPLGGARLAKTRRHRCSFPVPHAPFKSIVTIFFCTSFSKATGRAVCRFPCIVCLSHQCMIPSHVDVVERRHKRKHVSHGQLCPP